MRVTARRGPRGASQNIGDEGEGGGIVAVNGGGTPARGRGGSGLVSSNALAADDRMSATWCIVAQ